MALGWAIVSKWVEHVDELHYQNQWSPLSKNIQKL